PSMQQAVRGPESEPESSTRPRWRDRASSVSRQARDATHAARDALLARQSGDGYWCFPCGADWTTPAEDILMMQCMDEIDPALERKFCVSLRACQAGNGGWSLFPGGDLDVSCSVKAYFALKLAGDDPAAPHMQRARDAILDRGGAVNANVF